MIVPELSTTDISIFQQAVAAANLQTARAQAIGGESWLVSMPGSGDGVNAPTGDDQPAGGVVAYVFRVKTSALERALAGDQVEVERWEFVAPSESLADDEASDGLWEGRTIESAADSALRFTIASLDVQSGYLSGTLKKERS